MRGRGYTRRDIQRLAVASQRSGRNYEHPPYGSGWGLLVGGSARLNRARRSGVGECRRQPWDVGGLSTPATDTPVLLWISANRTIQGRVCVIDGKLILVSPALPFFSFGGRPTCAGGLWCGRTAASTPVVLCTRPGEDGTLRRRLAFCQLASSWHIRVVVFHAIPGF